MPVDRTVRMRSSRASSGGKVGRTKGRPSGNAGGPPRIAGSSECMPNVVVVIPFAPAGSGGRDADPTLCVRSDRAHPTRAVKGLPRLTYAGELGYVTQVGHFQIDTLVALHLAVEGGWPANPDRPPSQGVRSVEVLG